MESKTKVVALTGGIGSGKSLVAGLFQSWGASIVDADILAREVVAPDSEGLAELQKAFPSEVLILADGSLNRSKLAAIIFADESARLKVEEILHPRIRQLWLNNLNKLKKSKPALIVYVVPLYFESRHKMPEIEKVILISAPDDLKLSRIMARDGFSLQAAELRLRAQLSDNEKISKSDFVIYNVSTIDAVTEKAREVFSTLIQSTPDSTPQ
jgi:dephospho-CoA kinase